MALLIGALQSLHDGACSSPSMTARAPVIVRVVFCGSARAGKEKLENVVQSTSMNSSKEERYYMQQMKIEMKSTDRWKHYPMFVVIQFQ
jgi:hypothetical protein